MNRRSALKKLTVVGAGAGAVAVTTNGGGVEAEHLPSIEPIGRVIRTEGIPPRVAAALVVLKQVNNLQDAPVYLVLKTPRGAGAIQRMREELRDQRKTALPGEPLMVSGFDVICPTIAMTEEMREVYDAARKVVLDYFKTGKVPGE